MRWLFQLATAASGLLVAAAPAWAETIANPPEPQKPWLQWLLLIGFTGACCGVAFKNSKRSHLG